MIPLGFFLQPPVMAGRDELTPLLLSCPADPSRQEMGVLLLALLLVSLPAMGTKKGVSPGVGFPCCHLAEQGPAGADCTLWG